MIETEITEVEEFVTEWVFWSPTETASRLVCWLEVPTSCENDGWHIQWLSSGDKTGEEVETLKKIKSIWLRIDYWLKLDATNILLLCAKRNFFQFESRCIHL